MKSGFGFFMIIGIIFFAFTIINVYSETLIFNDVNNSLIVSSISNIPRKKDLIGTYIVKSDKKTSLVLNDDGTYNLVINVCDDYLNLSGNYELRDSKLILRNDSDYYEDLDGNLELSFTIIDYNKIKVDENLVCTFQETLFEK